MITYNNIIGRFEKFVEDHFLLKTFTHGSPSGVDLEKFEVYPALHVVYTGSTYDNTSKEYSFEVYILDLPPDKAKKIENQTQLVSNAEQVAEDILADMRNGGHIFDFGHLYTVGNASTTPLEETTSNSLAGILLTISIEVGFTFDSCNAPLDGVNPEGSAFPSASPSGLRIKEVDGSPDVVGVTTIIVSDGTLTDDGLGVVTIDTSDKGAGVYLPLIGGTLTGDLIVDTKIGIGTTTPSEQLEVIGDILVSGDTMSDAYKPNAAGEPIKLKNFGGDEVVTVLDSGDVGIGTNPTEKLDVVGNIAVSGTVDGVDVAARDAILTSTTTTANDALPKSGGALTGELDMNSNKITNVLAGSNNLDAVNYQQLNDAILGVLTYKGTWNASTNSPALVSGVGTLGGYYIVETAGTTDLDGITDWAVGDWAVFSDLPTDAWQKIDNTSILGGAGTGGKISVWTGSGVSRTLGDSVITESGGKIGIGTTSPTGKLDVREDNVTISTSNSMSDGIRGLKISGSNAGIELVGSGDDWWVSALGSGLSIYDTTANAYRLKILNNGNVGIGTTSPVSKLDVRGRTDVNIGGEGLYFKAGGDTANNGRSLEFSSSSNNGSFGALHTINAISGNGVIALATSSSERMRIDNSGNVGIGTDSPTAKLEVDGNVKIGDGTTGATFTKSGNDFLIQGVDVDGNAWNSIHLKADSLTGLYIEKDTNNVGIGTDSPAATLDVASSNPSIRITNTTNPLGNGTVGSFEFFTKDSSTGATRTVSSIVCDNNAGSSVPEGELVFNTSLGGGGSPVATEKMRIDATGNVGIGTTSPIGMLSVVNPQANSNTWTPTNKPDLWVSNAGTSNSYYALGVTTSSGDVLAVTNAGNVGIGTASPNQLLEIKKTSGEVAVRLHADHTSVPSAVIEFMRGTSDTWGGDAYTDWKIGALSTADFAITSKDTTRGEIERLTIDYATGNVGIGTTSPASRLGVSGGDVEVQDIASGIIMKSPDGTRYRVTVADGGTLSVAAV